MVTGRPGWNVGHGYAHGVGEKSALKRTEYAALAKELAKNKDRKKTKEMTRTRAKQRRRKQKYKIKCDDDTKKTRRSN